MIERQWPRIGGLHVIDDGTMAAVWLAFDRDSDVAHLYDACIFRREVLAVIAEGLNARGRWIEIAWEKDAKSVADALLERGCNMAPEPADDTDAMSEVVSRGIWERMRSGRFRVDRRLAEWKEEFRSFQRQDNKIPRESHPLMAATRHAMQLAHYARPQDSGALKSKAYPALAIV